MTRAAWTAKRWLINLRWPGAAGLALLALAVVFYLGVIQPARQRAQSLEQEVAGLSKRLSGRTEETTRVTGRSQLADFYAFFPLVEGVPEMLGRVQEAAQRNGLALEKGEYRLGQDKDFRLVRYQATFPLRGGYADVRGFVNDVLEQVPSAALEELTLKRASIDDPQTEARVRFTLFLGLR